MTTYAMWTGIYAHPDWYSGSGLTANSSFEEFQAYVHNHNRSSCPYLPCECHTALMGEPCYETVSWNNNSGIWSNPDWYPGLSDNSSFEEFQLSAHKKNPAECPKPCEKRMCHTAVESEPCYTKVMWAMTTGVFTHPEWYTKDGLGDMSSFEEFQAWQHGKSPESCPMPCLNWKALH